MIPTFIPTKNLFFFLKKIHYILGSLPHQYNRPSHMFNVYLVFHGVSSLGIMH